MLPAHRRRIRMARSRHEPKHNTLRQTPRAVGVMLIPLLLTVLLDVSILLYSAAASRSHRASLLAPMDHILRTAQVQTRI